MAAKEKISITLDKDVFDYIEYGIRMRWWPSRSAGVNIIITQFMRQQNQANVQQPGNLRRNSRVCLGRTSFNLKEDGWDIHRNLRKDSNEIVIVGLDIVYNYCFF